MLIPFDYLFRKYSLSPKAVLHVGSSTGQEAAAYRACGIGKAIFIEAIPEVYVQLLKNLVPFFPGYVAFNECITDKDGEWVEFNVSSNGGQSSSIYEFGTHTVCHPDVTFVDKLRLQTKRIDTLIKEYQIDFSDISFINFDIQGAELLALKSMGDLLKNVTAAYLEVNKKETYKDCALVGEIDEYLSHYGFVRVETTSWVGDTWADAFYLRGGLNANN